MVGESSEVTISLLKDEADVKKYDLINGDYASVS